MQCKEATVHDYVEAIGKLSVVVHHSHVEDSKGYRGKRLHYDVGTRRFNIVVTIIPSADDKPMYVLSLIIDNYYDLYLVLNTYNDLRSFDNYTLV